MLKKLSRDIAVILGALILSMTISLSASAIMAPSAGRLAEAVVSAMGPTRAAVELEDLTTATLAASRTFEVETNAYFGLAVIWICVTDANNSVTDLDMLCTGSKNNNTTDYVLQDVAATGVSTDTPAFSKDPSGMTNKCWPWRLDIEGIEDFECALSDTGGDGSDSYNVDVTLATKGG